MINYGVIVGRFQVDSLHLGHLELFRQVSEKHDRVIVFVGVPRTVPTKRNPLDFETRKKMIQADYPDFIILPLRDEKNDQFWSDKLDEAIGSVTNFTNHVTLYGGRDSFTPHYFEIHPDVLCFDHINGDGKEERARFSNEGPACGLFILDLIFDDTRFGHALSKYQILCRNCNHLKSQKKIRYNPFTKRYWITPVVGEKVSIRKNFT